MLLYQGKEVTEEMYTTLMQEIANNQRAKDELEKMNRLLLEEKLKIEN